MNECSATIRGFFSLLFRLYSHDRFITICSRALIVREAAVLLIGRAKRESREKRTRIYYERLSGMKWQVLLKEHLFFSAESDDEHGAVADFTRRGHDLPIEDESAWRILVQVLF